jgi:hypothetical protein
MKDVDSLKRKYAVLNGSFSERSRRLWAGAEADALGRSGVRLVATATGLAISTIGKGRDEVRRGVVPSDLVSERRRGGGRPRLEEKHPQLVERLRALVSPSERGDPEGPLLWTTLSVRSLSAKLTFENLPVSPQKVSELLKADGFTLQGTSRIKEGAQHPDRDAQFLHINDRSEEHIKRGQPVISVDTKKKESVGDFSMPGRTWQPKGKPIEVGTYMFLDRDGDRAIPYGIYDVAANAGFVNVGVDHDTPRFAVNSIEKWWETYGHAKYPESERLFITADSGGSNSAVSRVWKMKLQEFADKSGLVIEVSHFPAGTSKWNKIEHRLFSYVTLNWRGRPLRTYETMLSLLRGTQTTKGLRVEATLDGGSYALSEGVSKRDFAGLALERHSFAGRWNYELKPRSPAQLQAAREPAPRRPGKQEIWGAKIEEQIASGMSCAAFCRKHALNYEAFISARRDLRGVLNRNQSRGRRKQLAQIRYDRETAE